MEFGCGEFRNAFFVLIFVLRGLPNSLEGTYIVDTDRRRLDLALAEARTAVEGPGVCETICFCRPNNLFQSSVATDSTAT